MHWLFIIQKKFQLTKMNKIVVKRWILQEKIRKNIGQREFLRKNVIKSETIVTIGENIKKLYIQ